jgi:hypothetical protein
MCSAPTCHVVNVRPSIDSPRIAVIPCNTPEYHCLWFQFYGASNFYCMAIATESRPVVGRRCILVGILRRIRSGGSDDGVKAMLVSTEKIWEERQY